MYFSLRLLLMSMCAWVCFEHCLELGHGSLLPSWLAHLFFSRFIGLWHRGARPHSNAVFHWWEESCTQWCTKQSQVNWFGIASCSVGTHTKGSVKWKMHILDVWITHEVIIFHHFPGFLFKSADEEYFLRKAYLSYAIKNYEVHMKSTSKCQPEKVCSDF